MKTRRRPDGVTTQLVNRAAMTITPVATPTQRGHLANNRDPLSCIVEASMHKSAPLKPDTSLRKSLPHIVLPEGTELAPVSSIDGVSASDRLISVAKCKSLGGLGSLAPSHNSSHITKSIHFATETRLRLDGVTGRPRRKPLACYSSREGALRSRLLARRWSSLTDGDI